MENKKKKVIIVGIVLLLIVAGLFGFQKFGKEKQENYNMVCKVYRWVKTEEYGDRNPLNLGITVSELEKNPPKVEMNGDEGLFVSTVAYNYATGNTIDYMDIKKLMDQGKALEVYKKYEDYINWFEAEDKSGRYVTGYGFDYRNSYNSAVINVAGAHGIKIDGSVSSYQDYKKIIETYPDEIDAFMNS